MRTRNLTRRTLAASLLPIVILTTTACGGSDAQDRKAFAAETVQRLRATLEAVPRESVAPGTSVAIDHPGHTPWAGSAGRASLQTGAPLDSDHRLRAGSLLKVAVAVAVLQQVERSRLSLSDPVAMRLPAHLAAQVPHAASITLRMLLNHSSGIPECADGDFDAQVIAEPGRVWTTDDYLARSGQQPRAFEPGAGWSYSNTNYILLGEVLAHATGRPWRQVVESDVFRRAGLRQSSLPEVGDLRCVGCARGYERIDNEWIDVTEIDPSMAGASGGHAWTTTPTDLNRLLRALFAGRLFDAPATLPLMTAFVPTPASEDFVTGYGLGLMRIEFDGQRYIGHYGGTAGFVSFMLYSPAQDTAFSGFLTTSGDLGALLAPLIDLVRGLRR